MKTLKAIKTRVRIGVDRRKEIITLINEGINTSYLISKELNLDASTVKHHLDWLEKRGALKSEFIVEDGRAKKTFSLTFPKDVTEVVTPVLDLLETDKEEGEKEIVKLSLDICDKIEKGELDFKKADLIFTALLTLKTEELRGEVEELLLLGNELHDLEKEWGKGLLIEIKNLAKSVTWR